jgi:hypothetical protein
MWRLAGALFTTGQQAGAAVGLAATIVALQISSKSCQQELARQQPGPGRPPPVPSAEAQLRKN